jgi:hypothetical protein
MKNGLSTNSKNNAIKLINNEKGDKMTTDIKVNKISPNEIIMLCPFKTAFGHVTEAIERLGKVKKSDRDQQYIEGKIKFGLQSVKVRVSFVERDEGKTNVVIQGSSDDVWGAGAKNATKRLVELLLNLDNPGYKPDRLGMHPAAIIGIVIGIIFLIILFL